MKIIINYSSTWRNSVLKGSNDEPICKRNTKISSKNSEQPDVRKISDNTVLGILCRLIGDQRKLYEAKVSNDFYFRGIDIKVSEVKKKERIWVEKAYLIRKTDEKGNLANRPPQGNFIGILDDNEPLFFSEYSATLWSILDYDFNELLDFILNPRAKKINATVSPKHILNRVLYEISDMNKIQFIKNKIKTAREKLNKEYTKENSSDKRMSSLADELKSLENESQNPELIKFEQKIKSSISVMQEKFSNETYEEKDKSIKPIRLYAGALYLLIDQLKKGGVDIAPLVSSNGKIKGFSKKGFNGVRDFLNPLMGNKKKTTHTPYNLTKADGQLEINLDIDSVKAKELKNMIECAGVSSFYLGKKGLAYISSISAR